MSLLSSRQRRLVVATRTSMLPPPSLLCSFFLWLLLASSLLLSQQPQAVVLAQDVSDYYETSMTTIPYFGNNPPNWNASNPSQLPSCNATFLRDFSAGVWDWIHGLIQFAIREHDFYLSPFTMSDRPYARYLALMEEARNDDERHRILTQAAGSCKTCKYLGCYVWCSPQLCKLCKNDDDDFRRHRRQRRKTSATNQQQQQPKRNLRSNDEDQGVVQRQQPQRQLQQAPPPSNTTIGDVIDYDLLGIKISEIVTDEARLYLQNYDPSQYQCMGVASGLQVLVRFIPYES